MVAAITYSVAEEELFSRAVVILINTDLAKFSTYYGGRARWCRPTVGDSLIQNPDCIVQSNVSGTPFARQIGSYAKTTHSVDVTFLEDPRSEPYSAGDVDTPESLINHFEKLLEYGSLDGTLPPDPLDVDYAADLAAYLASRNGKGWLIDPDSSPGDAPVARYLNNKAPTITRLQPRVLMDLENEHVVSMAFTVVVTWEAFVDRLKRSRG